MMLALQDLLESASQLETQSIVLPLGVSESVLSTWGAKILNVAGGQTPSVHLALHSHRGPVVIDRVLNGSYKAGIVAGSSLGPKTLDLYKLGSEPMVIMYPPDGARYEEQDPIRLISIEEQSGTWQEISTRVTRFRRRKLMITTRVESFMSAAAMCEASFGPALIPLGVAHCLGVPRTRWDFLPEITRDIYLVSRRKTLQLPIIQAFAGNLRKAFANRKQLS